MRNLLLSDDGFLGASRFFKHKADNAKRPKEEIVMGFTAITAVMDTVLH